MMIRPLAGQMRKWTKLLPLFVVEWYAKRRCEWFVKYGIQNTGEPLKQVVEVKGPPGVRFRYIVTTGVGADG